MTEKQSGEHGPADIRHVRAYFDFATDTKVTDEQVLAALDWFRRDSQKHMLAARSIVKSFQIGGKGTDVSPS